MEARIGGEAHHFYNPDAPVFLLKEKDLMGIGKRSLNWDLNDWKWDGDLFIASPSQSVPSDYRSRQLVPMEAEVHVAGAFSNSSSSSSDEINPQNENGKRELEKRRRVVVIEDDESNDEAGNLALKLGGNVYPIAEDDVANWDVKSGKKTKLLGGTINRAICQVEDCGADLSNAKDYHKRHKVCDIHSKASKALVGNVMQRFCQQCSRFHLLQEFDEGKRSCRRRLAGHNKRRRKTQPEAVANGSSLNDDRASNYLLISLLRILSNLHSNNSDQTKDQDILSHLMRNLASFANSFDGRNTSGLLQGSQDLLNAGTSSKTLPAFPSNNCEPSGVWGSTSTLNIGGGVQDSQMRPVHQYVNVPVSEVPQQGNVIDNACGGALQTVTLRSTTVLPVEKNHPTKAEVRDSTAGRIKLNNIDLNYIYNDSQDSVEVFERSRIPLDLNDIYNDSQDCIEGFESSQIPVHLGTSSPDCPSWVQQDSHQSSPPQTSGASDQSLSTSSGDAQFQGRTDRIVFKLFGKYPNDFPLVLRAQIVDWLSNSPMDIESYIRPGCIILTIYVHLAESTWEKLCCDLSSSLSKLLDVSNDPFWRTGWVYARVQHRIAFIYDGQVVLDTPLPFTRHNDCRISSISPVAVCASERTQFMVKGFNLSQPTTSLLCTLEGKYLVQEATHDLEGVDTLKEDDELQYLSFTCSVPDVTGRGFIEVEDHGLSSSFFPYIVAEQDVCSEIRMLESAIEISESDDDIQGTTRKTKAKNRALDFIHEMGWLLHRSRLRSRLGLMDPNLDAFPFTRFRGILEFSMDHDWCAVLKKLLDILFEGTVDAGGHRSIELALSEMGLLHKAVRRSCRPVVELLLRYVPVKAKLEHKQRVNVGLDGFFFKPDAVGPAGLTPLHVAASGDGSESMLDALTDDPGSVGIVAWKSVRDNTGFTPEDYARLRGHFSYIHLVQKKINKKSEAGHVTLDIPDVLSACNNKQKQENGLLKSSKVTGFQIDKTGVRQMRQHCNACNRQLAYGNARRSVVYRPAMLSMVAIAAVCVCLGLLFKSSPEVLCIFRPFRWESLDFGPM